MPNPRVLIISSIDPSGGAGLIADVRAVCSCDCDPAAAVAALTVQSDAEVFGVFPQSGEVLRAQIEAAVTSSAISAVKIGLLPTAELVRAAASVLSLAGIPHIVVDPVLRSSSGYRLADEDVPRAMQQELFPIAEVVTPNLGEAALHAGMEVCSIEDMELAAGTLLRFGMTSVVIKGGHLSGHAVDLYADGELRKRLEGERIEGSRRRGTGCTFASALASALARGMPRVEAAGYAKEHTRQYIAGKSALRPPFGAPGAAGS